MLRQHDQHITLRLDAQFLQKENKYLMLSSCLSYFREHPFGIHLQIVDGQTWTDYLDFSCAE